MEIFGLIAYSAHLGKEYVVALSLCWKPVKIFGLMDHLHYRLNFDLNKSRQKFDHSLKEHHKISNIPRFRCEML